MLRILSLTLIVSGFLSFIFTASANAADVVKIKGSSALIDLKGEPAAPGDMFYAVSSDGKKRGILQVTKVKGDKAIARLTKGKAAVGMTLEPKAPGGPVAKSRSSGSKGNMYWGGLLGYGMDSAKVKVLWQTTAGGHTAGDTKEIATLSGSGITAVGLFDYGFTNNFWIRGLFGLENFNVTGPASCGTGNDTTCDSKIMYLNGAAVARWLFMTGDIRPWAGAGIGIMFPVTKSSTAFDAASIASTQVILVEGGVDWFISPTMYIPISVEYGLLPKSAQVEASWIELRVGVAVPY